MIPPIINTPLQYFAKEIVPYHLSATTSQLTLGLPIFATIETAGLNFTTSEANGAAITSMIIAYCGWEFLYAKSREYLKNKLSIIESSTEKEHKSIDKKIKMGMNTIRSLGKYFFGGVTDPWKISSGIGIGLCYGKIFGGISGQLLDIYQDTFNIKKSHRVPNWFRKQNNTSRKVILAGLTSASFISTVVINNTIPQLRDTLEKKIEQHLPKSNVVSDNNATHFISRINFK